MTRELSAAAAAAVVSAGGSSTSSPDDFEEDSWIGLPVTYTYNQRHGQKSAIAVPGRSVGDSPRIYTFTKSRGDIPKHSNNTMTAHYVCCACRRLLRGDKLRKQCVVKVEARSGTYLTDPRDYPHICGDGEPIEQCMRTQMKREWIDRKRRGEESTEQMPDFDLMVRDTLSAIKDPEDQQQQQQQQQQQHPPQPIPPQKRIKLPATSTQTQLPKPGLPQVLVRRLEPILDRYVEDEHSVPGPPPRGHQIRQYGRKHRPPPFVLTPQPHVYGRNKGKASTPYVLTKRGIQYLDEDVPEFEELEEIPPEESQLEEVLEEEIVDDKEHILSAAAAPAKDEEFEEVLEEEVLEQPDEQDKMPTANR